MREIGTMSPWLGELQIVVSLTYHDICPPPTLVLIAVPAFASTTVLVLPANLALCPLKPMDWASNFRDISAWRVCWGELKTVLGGGGGRNAQVKDCPMPQQQAENKMMRHRWTSLRGLHPNYKQMWESNHNLMLFRRRHICSFLEPQIWLPGLCCPCPPEAPKIPEIPVGQSRSKTRFWEVKSRSKVHEFLYFWLSFDLLQGPPKT